MAETQAGYEAVVELTRGGIVECVHYGALAVVDSAGNLLTSLGDPKLVTFPRSSMKPLQAIPFVEDGGPEHYGFTEEELAILCASHHGTDEHVRVLRSIHEKVGLQESDLQCGVHWPSDKATTLAMRERGEEPTSYRHNCSGKHSGMLAQALLHDYSKDEYLSMENPLQQRILKTVAEMCVVEPKDMAVGIDGCSAPVFAMPLYNFALAMARLADPIGLGGSRASACQKITHAMMAYPEMVAGPGALDSVLMSLMQGKAAVKGGAEGYQMISLMPGACGKGSPGIGVAFKISDGDPNRRATYSLIVALLRALGFEDEMASEAFRSFNTPLLKNWRGLEIGEIRTAKPIEITKTW
ncbi:MAG TPA: asparaginase [Anaerolineaceae bacterium]|nr:asparaginase [Anaerolineaceae bacterium]